jgi:hypothetical protein
MKVEGRVLDPSIRRNQIREEAERGEKILEQEASSGKQLGANSSNSQEIRPVMQRQGSSRHGRRNPKRDPVGSEQLKSQQD